MATVHAHLRLYTSKDVYVIEPGSSSAGSLVIERGSGDLSIKDQGSIPADTRYESVVELVGILGIVTLLAGDYLVGITAATKIGRLLDNDVLKITKTKIFPVARGLWTLTDAQKRDEEAYVSLLERMSNAGHMYFSRTWDLSTLVQTCLSRPNSDPLWQKADPRFFWNRHVQSKLIEKCKADPRFSPFVLPVICGFVKISTVTLNRCQFQYTLITRKRVHRVGTRYHSRGIDDHGHVSNFCETEQIVTYHNPTEMSTHVRAFVQVRGSIPLFWRQKINSKYTPILEIVHKPNSHQVFSKHVNELFIQYGESQVMVNLINKKGYEMPLGNEFQRHVDTLADKRLKYIHFDFHTECKKMRYDRISLLIDQIQGDLQRQSSFAATISASGAVEVHSRQTGVVRTNCVDCLDRTNVVQSVIARSILVNHLASLGIVPTTGSGIPADSELELMLKNVWADNADVVSMLYSGTGALKTDYTRTGKRTKAGILMDGWNSTVRYIKNNFLDGARQDAYDLFLGNYVVGVTPNQRPYAQSRLTEAHYLVLGVLAMAIVAFLLVMVMSREFSTMFRAILFINFSLVAAIAVLLHKRGTELVDLPRLVAVDYMAERENGKKIKD